MKTTTFAEGAGLAAAMPEAWQGRMAGIVGDEAFFVAEHADRDEYARFSVGVADISAVVPDPSSGDVFCVLGVDGGSGEAVLALHHVPWPAWTKDDEDRLPAIVAALFPEPSVFGD